MFFLVGQGNPCRLVIINKTKNPHRVYEIFIMFIKNTQRKVFLKQGGFFVTVPPEWQGPKCIKTGSINPYNCPGCSCEISNSLYLINFAKKKKKRNVTRSGANMLITLFVTCDHSRQQTSSEAWRSCFAACNQHSAALTPQREAFILHSRSKVLFFAKNGHAFGGKTPVPVPSHLST